MASAAKRTLVVDDDVDFAEALASLLELEGFSIDVVHSAEAALEAVRNADYDFVLVDIGLPGTTGVECVEQIAKSGVRANLFLMTGYSAATLQQRGIAVGERLILTKPIDPNGLVERLNSL